jgi:putative addiction module CopG family antidote
MPTKNVNLTPDLMQFVADEIAAGEYSNHSEVVRAGLSLLRVRTAKQRALLAEIEASRAEFEAGKSVKLTRELLRTIADGAKKRARKHTATLA